MGNPVRILSISDDDGLRFSRHLLLDNYGYEAESISSNTPLSASLARHFDIALICRSVERQRMMALADMLRRYNPKIQIICIDPLEHRETPCDADFAIPSGPESVLEAIRELCKQKPVHHEPYAASPRG